MHDYEGGHGKEGMQIVMEHKFYFGLKYAYGATIWASIW